MVRCLFLLPFLAFPVMGQDEGKAPPRGTPGPAGEAAPFPFPELAHLELFVGPWGVSESHFNPRGEIIGSAKGTEEITWILDYHAIRRVYNTGGGAAKFRATGTLSWNNVEKKFHGAWFDNASGVGPSIVKGTWDAATRTMILEMESAGEKGGVVRHRVVEKFETAEKRVATTYLVDGPHLVKRIEVEYHRTQPCPDRIRGIFDGG